MWVAVVSNDSVLDFRSSRAMSVTKRNAACDSTPSGAALRQTKPPETTQHTRHNSTRQEAHGGLTCLKQPSRQMKCVGVSRQGSIFPSTSNLQCLVSPMIEHWSWKTPCDPEFFCRRLLGEFLQFSLLLSPPQKTVLFSFIIC